MFSLKKAIISIRTFTNNILRKECWIMCRIKTRNKSFFSSFLHSISKEIFTVAFWDFRSWQNNSIKAKIQRVCNSLFSFRKKMLTNQFLIPLAFCGLWLLYIYILVNVLLWEKNVYSQNSKKEKRIKKFIKCFVV